MFDGRLFDAYFFESSILQYLTWFICEIFRLYLYEKENGYKLKFHLFEKIHTFSLQNFAVKIAVLCVVVRIKFHVFATLYVMF